MGRGRAARQGLLRRALQGRRARAARRGRAISSRILTPSRQKSFASREEAEAFAASGGGADEGGALARRLRAGEEAAEAAAAAAEGPWARCVLAGAQSVALSGGVSVAAAVTYGAEENEARAARACACVGGFACAQGCAVQISHRTAVIGGAVAPLALAARAAQLGIDAAAECAPAATLLLLASDAVADHVRAHRSPAPAPLNLTLSLSCARPSAAWPHHVDRRRRGRDAT
jgi:hypothetical protein